MTWRSFQKLCRRNAERVPYHPEAFLQDAPSRPPQPLFVRFAALAGTAAVLVVAVAAVLLSSLFRSPSIPAGPDGGSALSSPLVPPDVDLLYIYSCLAEMTYTKKVEPFDAAANMPIRSTCGKGESLCLRLSRQRQVARKRWSRGKPAPPSSLSKRHRLC